MTGSSTTHLFSGFAYRYALLSVTAVLYVFSWSVLLWIGSGELRSAWQQAVPFTVELQEGLSASDIFRYEQQLQSRPFVQPGSLNYIPKSEGIRLLQAELGRDSLLLFGENPLPDLFRFQLKSYYLNQIDSLQQLLLTDPPVAQAYSDDRLLDLARRMSGWSGWLGLLVLMLGAGAVLFIRYALRLALGYAQNALPAREALNAEELRISYRRQSLISGCISGAATSILTLITALSLNSALGDVFSWWQDPWFWILLALPVPAASALWWLSLKTNDIKNTLPINH